MKLINVLIMELAWSGYNFVKIISTLNQELLIIKSLKIIDVVLIQVQNYFYIFFNLFLKIRR